MMKQKTFSIFTLSMLIIAVLGSLFLAWLELKNNDPGAGIIYTLMFLIGGVLLMIVIFWSGGDQKLTEIQKYIKIPISTKFSISVFFYFIGFWIPLIIQGIISLFRVNFSITNYSVPLYGAGIRETFQSFSAAEIGGSMAWKIFNIMYVAGTDETFIYSFISVILGIFIALTFLKLYNDGKDLSWISKKNFVILIGFITSMLTFIISHVLNGSYELKEFIVAGIFFLISTYSIYKFGLFLAFWMGTHQSNNLLWLISEEGIIAVLKCFISVFGGIFIISMALIVFYIIRNWGTIKIDLRVWFRESFPF